MKYGVSRRPTSEACVLYEGQHALCLRTEPPADSRGHSAASLAGGIMSAGVR